MKYKWVEVNDALEVLSLNKHVKESEVKIDIYSDNTKRVIYLTNEGAIAYRTNYYIKEAEKELSVIRSYQIQKRDLWLKKRWLLVEAAKYIMGGIIGALIALGASQIRKSPQPTQQESQLPKTNKDSAYTKKDTFLVRLFLVRLFLKRFMV